MGRHVKFVSAGKTEYKTEKSVAETLVARKDMGSEGSEFTLDMSDVEEPGCSKASSSREVEREAEGCTSQPVAQKTKTDVDRQ